MNNVLATEKPARSRAYLRFRARLLIGLALMAVLAVAVVVIQIQSADQERKAALRKQTEHYVQAIEAHVVYSIQFIDLSLTGFANAIEVLSPQQAASASTIAALLSSRGTTFTRDYWITFIDAHGIAVAASNNLHVAGISYADRDYFKVHLGKNRISGLYVGEPMVGQASKQRLFALSRRVENAKGEFLGVIVAPLDANRFAKVFDDSRFSPDVSITLVHGKGKIIARAPNFEAAFGRRLDATALFDNIRKSKSGTYQATSSIDGLLRVFSYRVLDDFPLIVVVGSSAQESNRIVERNTLIAGGGLGLLLALMLAGGHFSLRTYTRLEERELRYRQLYVSSRETKAKLSESEQLGALMYRNSSEGMMVTDAEGRILSVNNAFTRLSGYTEQEVVGHHAYELTSGRQDENFFHRMEQSISASGQWEGEMWHQHKNGEHYLVALRFNTVYDNDGKAFRHVGL
ncbi:MAG TPA: PAS domain-containing protein, partial [Telluria sp.]|nr:PAS domain-containing protein [Telluria sp.]